jgi:hypothetical protein
LLLLKHNACLHLPCFPTFSTLCKCGPLLMAKWSLVNVKGHKSKHGQHFSKQIATFTMLIDSSRTPFQQTMVDFTLLMCSFLAQMFSMSNSCNLHLHSL